MADSEDEYDKKRRDKFRGERSSGSESYRTERREERRRDDWPDRNPFRSRARPEYREYRGGRDRFSPGRELPAAKRMRPDWGDEPRPRYGMHDGYGIYGWGQEHYSLHGMHNFGHPPILPPIREQQNNPDMQTQPPMLTLKQFLDTQDDGISDSEVMRKYTDYKLDFKRQQLNEFFVAHKDEEWFKSKYHPEESLKRKEEQLLFLKKRVEVFTDVLEKGMISKVSVDTNQADGLLRLLDTVVIKLEGGTDDDLKVLDEKPQEIKANESAFPNIKKNEKYDDDVIITAFKENKKLDNPDEIDWEPIPSKQKPKSVQDVNEDNWDCIVADSDTGKLEKGIKEGEWDSEPNKSKKDIDDWELSPPLNKNKNIVTNECENEISINKKTIKENIENSGNDSWSSSDDKTKLRRKRKHSSNSEASNSSSSSKSQQGILENENNMDIKKSDSKINLANEESLKAAKIQTVEGESAILNKNSLSELKSDEEFKKDEAAENSDKEKDNPETIDLDNEKDTEVTEEIKPRALHRTSSIFLRNLAPAITKSEIETICKRYDGFLRVAIADPLAERRWFRRGWVTFKRDTNIKEICWNLNNLRLKDCEMGAIVNRDLTRRVRPVNGITAHKTVIRNDVKLCAKIVLNLDEKSTLWPKKGTTQKSENNGINTIETFGFKSNNPVLQNITDYLIEEASAEEEELLGLGTENKDLTDGETLERDPQLISVLDKLILYLRIVHSVDFYNHCEYPYEDEMPNRCGIIHARGPPPQNKVSSTDIQDYIKNFEIKMSPFLTKSTIIEDEEFKNLGAKDPEAEVEKFIQANTQELAKDKWLCPLSGKKFKGPDFIRKHIFNKHPEKIEEVRKEVEYFNNYLRDSKKPQLPEHPGNTRRQPSDAGAHIPYRPGYPALGYIPPYAAYAPPMIAPPRRGFGGRRGPGNDYRPIIHYRDLDAPRESVDFL